MEKDEPVYHKNYMKILKKKIHEGFTLVELMIVIAVIAILATITVVSYNGVRNDSIKSAYDATAQQVKLKLGEHYTDNNRYPLNKTAVETYLSNVNAGGTLIADFSEAEIVYAAYTDGSGSTACSSGPDCQYYEITIDKTHWNGSTEDTNIVVKP